MESMTPSITKIESIIQSPVTRRGEEVMPNFRVNDTIPAGLQYLGYSATNGTYNNNTGMWTGISLNTMIMLFYE